MAPASAPELPLDLRALAGDGPSLACLYASHHPLVLCIARRIVARLRLDEAPHELAAEVWLRLLDRGCRVLRAFDPARGSVHGFMKMVAWQHALAVARRWQRRGLREAALRREAPAEPPVPCVMVTLHQRLLLRRTLAAVPELTAIDLVLLEDALAGPTLARELAPHLGCSITTLHQHRRRLRARLRAAGRSIEGGLLA